ncbi:TetR/AcrR family transcriptional regulator [Schaalia sp. 19OD2882]|uniref:TetR/AcrR family transcriptional regulator n=1 Tax=Schaalia sp. 19OD2882 TaxID=2794089 RepID=UPI001C1ED98C|nr:TetR/AcrR family transcriptional regulator [Schaalia sp. 19OD2882]QWW19582.1 TetR/AcrR family transcriptional regulator [Schaalia sp. 19OD2882]
MPRPLIPHRRERILDAAHALILERGFNAMSIQAIAERVGIAKGAVYREFTSKQEILDVLLTESMGRMVRASRALLGEEPSRLSSAYRVGVRVLLDEPLMTAAFLDDEGVLGTYISEVSDGRYRARYLAVVEWIRELQRAGALAADVDAESLGLALSSTTLGLLTAAKHLGPLTRDQLEGALEAMEHMVSRLEDSAVSSEQTDDPMMRAPEPPRVGDQLWSQRDSNP